MAPRSSTSGKPAEPSGIRSRATFPDRLESLSTRAPSMDTRARGMVKNTSAELTEVWLPWAEPKEAGAFVCPITL